MQSFENSRIDLRLLYRLSNLGHIYLIKWCMLKRLIPKEYKCPKCSRGMKLAERNDLTDGYIWSCRVYGEDTHCVKRSIRKNTWFIDSRISIVNILLVTYFWIKKVGYEFVMDELSITYTTVSERFIYCQQLCNEICVLESELLGGEGLIVEIYETQYVQLKNLRYKGESGNWLLIGIEKNTKKYFFRICDSKSKKALLNVIENWILPGSVVISNFWNTYKCFTDKQFKRLKTSQKLTFQHPDKKHSSSNETIFSIVKNLIRSSCSNDVLIMHVAEYLWRRSYNNNARSLIESFFRNLTKIYPPQDSYYME